MVATSNSNGRFRLGDSVEFQYGARLVVGQVAEDRGPIGFRGKRMYSVRLDLGSDPVFIEMPEDDLMPAPPNDVDEWRRNRRTTANHQTVTYTGEQTDDIGRPSPLYHYLIVSRPGSGSPSWASTALRS